MDIYDPRDVTWAITTWTRPDSDVIVIPHAPSFRVDPDAIHLGRLGIDATRPLGAGERLERRQIPGEEQVDLAAYLGEG